ncbi:MAG: putative DNA binding domain-containing protein [Deltaproteobacteria bacterium]|jgi:ATP-dependent DNA helicase RecG|nr:putative DNA binding domain-containing protein [Deltaproteobacteria bacterium]
MAIFEENEKLEFKSSTAELKEAIISISAILNKHNGGELYFGINDNGVPIGIQISTKTLRDISQGIGFHLEPKIYPKISKIIINDKECVHVEFSGKHVPYYAFGRAYIRIADENKLMSRDEIEIYFLENYQKRNNWDSQISAMSIANLPEDELREFIKRANVAERIDFSYTTKEEVLNKLELVFNGKLKNAADVLFCGSSLMEVQMANFATDERLTIIDIKRANGNITNLINLAEKYLRSSLHWKVVLDGSIERKEIPEIPMDAIREAIVNSFCHRDYESSQTNEIAIFSNRVEIFNPGEFPEWLTPHDFIDGKAHSVKRNPLLARLLFYRNDVEIFGTGLKRIVSACEQANVKVEFNKIDKGFVVAFYRPNTTPLPAAAITATAPILSKHEQAVLSIINKYPSSTTKIIAAKLGKNIRTIQRYVNNLQNNNIIKHVGSIRNGFWIIINKPKYFND